MRFSRRPLMLAAAGFAVLPSTLLAQPATATARAAAPVSTLSALGVTGCPSGLTPGSSVSPGGGRSFVVCTGRVRSFDGTPLDTDVAIPTAPTSRPRPLFIFLHGWGQDKATWESTTLAGNNADSYQWNNAWFGAQGYVVLNYTARGFLTSCGKDAAKVYVYISDPTCSDTTGEASWTHLVDRRWETHDTQYLAGLLVDAGVADPQRIAASGGSYGGGQSQCRRRAERAQRGGGRAAVGRHPRRHSDADHPHCVSHRGCRAHRQRPPRLRAVPQAWQFQRGDQLKLELTQDDQPVWRPDNEPSSLSFSSLDLALPLATSR